MKRNKTKAFKYILEASELGDVDAILEVAECYETGYGVKKDPEKAFLHYQKAADQNHPKGFYKVGSILLLNPKEKSGGETAIGWLDKAAAAGEPMAMRTLIRLFETSGVPYLRKNPLLTAKNKLSIIKICSHVPATMRRFVALRTPIFMAIRSSRKKPGQGIRLLSQAIRNERSHRLLRAWTVLCDGIRSQTRRCQVARLS
ncbi:MAG: sel1 repeat family protein [Bacillus subtilis]|nr:sel1 repeat family protein [Bacillus subtilis]